MCQHINGDHHVDILLFRATSRSTSSNISLIHMEAVEAIKSVQETPLRIRSGKIGGIIFSRSEVWDTRSGGYRSRRHRLSTLRYRVMGPDLKYSGAGWFVDGIV